MYYPSIEGSTSNSMKGNPINDLGNPTGNHDATHKLYVDTADTILNNSLNSEITNRIVADTLKLNLTGGVLSGSIQSSSFIKTGGTADQYLMADGTISTISASGQSNIYLYTADITNTLPTGYIRYNNSNQGLATNLSISCNTIDNVNIEVYLTLINQNSIIYIQKKNDALKYQKFDVIGTPILISGNNINLTVLLKSSSGGNFTNTEDLFISIFSDLTDLDIKVSALETAMNLKLNLTGGTMSGDVNMNSNKITSTYVPVNSSDLTN